MSTIRTTFAGGRVVYLIWPATYLRKVTKDSACNPRKNSYPLSMAYTDIFGNLQIAGIDIPIMGEACLLHVDDSFSHEFGVEHADHWEIEEVDNIEVDGNLRELLVDNQHAIGYTNHNRRFKKNLRRLEKMVISAVNSADYESFTEKEIDRAIENAED
jgi:hypothetical protein